MRRRDLLLFAALGLMSFAASATLLHATDKVWRLGVLSLVNNPAMHNAALSQLAERGFVEGQNLRRGHSRRHCGTDAGIGARAGRSRTGRHHGDVRLGRLPGSEGDEIDPDRSLADGR